MMNVKSTSTRRYVVVNVEVHETTTAAECFGIIARIFKMSEEDAWSSLGLRM